MNPKIYFSCLVVIIGSLVWTASARPGFEADRARVLATYGNASPESIRDGNVHFLVNFLDQYGDQIELTPDQRERANNVVRQYKEERASQPLVEGVPPQGGWFSSLLKIVWMLGVELAGAGLIKATAEN